MLEIEPRTSYMQMTHSIAELHLLLCNWGSVFLPYFHSVSFRFTKKIPLRMYACMLTLHVARNCLATGHTHMPLSSPSCALFCRVKCSSHFPTRAALRQGCKNNCILPAQALTQRIGRRGGVGLVWIGWVRM